MRCLEFEDRLNHLLDERERPESDPLVVEHLESCPTCRRHWTLLEGTLASLCELAAPAPSADLPGRVVADLRVDLVRPASRWAAERPPSRIWPALATAAALLVVCTLAARGLRTPANPAAPAADGTGSAAPALAATPPRRALRSPAPHADIRAQRALYSELARDTGQGLGLVVLSIPEVASELSANASTGDPSTGQASAAAWAPVSRGLRPVKTSVNETWQILKQAWPSADSAGPSSG